MAIDDMSLGVVFVEGAGGLRRGVGEDLCVEGGFSLVCRGIGGKLIMVREKG